jgi:DNA (cytosine-5)-methyltransferase 1
MSITESKKIYAVDLFCGAGGLSHGLRRAGVEVRLGIDIDPACEYPFTTNNKSDFLLKSVADVSITELKTAYPIDGYKLLAGCSPCQTFSRYNQKANSSDKRWWLLDEFGRLINELRPELITMENVPGLVEQRVFAKFENLLRRLNYFVYYEVVNCSEYGIPQKRRRLVLLASRLGPIKLISSREICWGKKDVRQAIGNLPPLEAGQIDKQDPLHQCAKLSELNIRRIQASIPGGSWRNWDKKLITPCHLKKTGKTYSSVYGRMKWDEPAPTMTTQFFGFGNGRFGHPEQDRAISLREGAILQSFPKSYKFIEPRGQICRKSLGQLIGNAVPVRLGELIGRSIHMHTMEI